MRSPQAHHSESGETKARHQVSWKSEWTRFVYCNESVQSHCSSGPWSYATEGIDIINKKKKTTLFFAGFVSRKIWALLFISMVVNSQRQLFSKEANMFSRGKSLRIKETMPIKWSLAMERWCGPNLKEQSGKILLLICRTSARLKGGFVLILIYSRLKHTMFFTNDCAVQIPDRSTEFLFFCLGTFRILPSFTIFSMDLKNST